MTEYYWMSFVDADRPKVEGEDRFLGALIIRAADAYEATFRSHFLKLNPGGEVMMFCIPHQFHERIPPDWIETRLITRKECEEFESLYAGEE